MGCKMFVSVSTLIFLAVLYFENGHCKPSVFVDASPQLSTLWIRLPDLVQQDQQIVNSGAALLISGGSKISSGSIALKQQFPHQAAILINFPDGSGTLCGGTIISSTFVLTVAHCLDGAIDAVVVVGTNTISIPSDAQAVEIDVTFHDMLVHPKYDPVDVLNDIAILRLTKALIFTDKIQPIRLPSRREAQVDLVNMDATVSGWGALSGDEFAEISDTLKLELRYVSNPVISNAVCGKVFKDMIHDFHVCVSGDNGRNACQGDSGGPLSASMGGKTTLIGIVSYGSTDGCEKGSPAVYTRVGFYLDWISHHTDIRIEN